MVDPGEGRDPVAPLPGPLGLVAGLAAWAMACQTSVVRRVRGIAVSSTFSTGMLTRLGHSLGSRRDPVRRPHERVVSHVLGVTIASFVLGALVGGLLLVAAGNAAVVAPAVGLVLVIVGFGRVPEVE